MVQHKFSSLEYASPIAQPIGAVLISIFPYESWEHLIWTMSKQIPNTALTSQGDHSSAFQQLENYTWDSDSEFQSGLQAILGSNPSAEQAEYLTQRARCFYFAR